MPDALIALGSNLGDREAIFAQAEARLARLPDVCALVRSQSYETAPVGGPAGQGPFLNAAVRLQTSLAPDALLESLQRIEIELGRHRTERWGPRPLDLDLLLYGPLVLSTPTLVLPHPRMAWRRFVLEPAAEVAHDMIHPAIGWTVGQLLDHLNTAAPYVAIAGHLVQARLGWPESWPDRAGSMSCPSPASTRPPRWAARIRLAGIGP